MKPTSQGCLRADVHRAAGTVFSENELCNRSLGTLLSPDSLALSYEAEPPPPSASWQVGLETFP